MMLNLIRICKKRNMTTDRHQKRMIFISTHPCPQELTNRIMHKVSLGAAQQ